MKRKTGCRLKALGCRKNQPAGFSLFELIISLTLISLMMLLLTSVETQTAKMWHELNEEEELVNEGRTLLQMICRDLRSATPSSSIELRENSNLFFLRRTAHDDLVAVDYFIDPNKKNHCYRFFANTNETLAAISNKNLAELESRAAAGELHSELIATHLLSWEMIPVWNKKREMILLEINLSFGKTTPRYFLSTAVALQK